MCGMILTRIADESFRKDFFLLDGTGRMITVINIDEVLLHEEKCKDTLRVINWNEDLTKCMDCRRNKNRIRASRIG